MVKLSFSIARLPEIYFGEGKILEAGHIAAKFGKRALLVTGNSFLRDSGYMDIIIKLFRDEVFNISDISSDGEPNPDFIDDVVRNYLNRGVDVVVAVGGGSVIDTGKAISAMLTQNKSVKIFLEGVGTGEKHNGEKVPFIAVPTTSGTGSEATKNAVLSMIGKNGFKKSLRHDNFVPDIAIIDPVIMTLCPQEITATTGLDATTQLLEAYTSVKSNALTDALARSGLIYAGQNLIPASTDKGGNIEVRAAMAYAALMSGITLANAGLGVVHGFASVIGGYFNIPHGVVCGTLFAAATKQIIKALEQEEDKYCALEKYAETGYMFANRNPGKTKEGCRILIDILYEWTEKLNIPRLGKYGISEINIDQVVKETGQKNNPINLSKNRLKLILSERL